MWHVSELDVSTQNTPQLYGMFVVDKNLCAKRYKLSIKFLEIFENTLFFIVIFSFEVEWKE